MTLFDLTMMKLGLFFMLGYFHSVLAATISTGECTAYTASNTQGAVQNIVNCEISVMPGDILHINTCNSSTLNGDTYLRLFDPSNTVELMEGDDGCGTERSGTSMTYEVPIAYPNTGVTLHLHQGCFSTFTCSAVVVYTLNVESLEAVTPDSHPTAAPAEEEEHDDDRYFDIRRCPLAECLDKNHPEKGWNECDMCICEDFDKIFLSDYNHDCQANEDFYMCMVKYDVKSVTCTTHMKPGWIAAFVFIGVFGFIIFGGAFGYVIYLLCFSRPNKPIQPMYQESPESEEVKAKEQEHDHEGVVSTSAPPAGAGAGAMQDHDQDPAKVKEMQLQLKDAEENKNGGYTNL